MKIKYIVETDVGAFMTYAQSPKKAIANIRYRLFGHTADASDTIYWTATPHPDGAKI